MFLNLSIFSFNLKVLSGSHSRIDKIKRNFPSFLYLKTFNFVPKIFVILSRQTKLYFQ